MNNPKNKTTTRLERAEQSLKAARAHLHDAQERDLEVLTWWTRRYFSVVSPEEAQNVGRQRQEEIELAHNQLMDAEEYVEEAQDELDDAKQKAREDDARDNDLAHWIYPTAWDRLLIDDENNP